MAAWGATFAVIVGALQLAVAVGLLILHRRSRPARSYALLLTLYAGFVASIGLTTATGTVSIGRAAGHAFGYFAIAIPFAAAYFVSIYPHPRRWLPRGVVGPAVFGLPALALMALHATHPTWFLDLSAYDGTLAPFADANLRKGGLVLFIRLVELTAAIIALVLAREFLHSDAPVSRRATAFVSMGFFIPAACTCSIAEFLFRAQSGLLFAGGAGFPVAVARGYDALLVLQLALVAALIVTAVRAATRNRTERRFTVAYVALLVATIGAAIAIGLMAPGPNQFESMYAMVAFWNLLGSLLVVYGILRFDVFDIDLRIKTGISRSVVAASIGAAAFVGSELVEQWLAIGQTWIALAIAALASLAFKPLHWFGRRLADRLMPDVADTQTYRAHRSTEIYQAAYEGMRVDGAVTAKEQAVLDTLASSLGLERAQVVAIEAGEA